MLSLWEKIVIVVMLLILAAIVPVLARKKPDTYYLFLGVAYLLSGIMVAAFIFMKY